MPPYPERAYLNRSRLKAFAEAQVSRLRVPARWSQTTSTRSARDGHDLGLVWTKKYERVFTTREASPGRPGGPAVA